MKQSGYADLPLHHGRVPQWLAERMSRLGGAIVEAIVLEYGTSVFLNRMSDPFWFQSLGAVMGMDWHSSGITTSVMGALKKAIQPKAHELGIYICGGRGKHSLKTPHELLAIGDKTGLDGNELVRCSRLAAKIDNTALQDGFQLYLHSFLLTNKGEWAVVQQGMNPSNGMARRYHWHSVHMKSFLEDPHTSVLGQNMGLILNLVHKDAHSSRKGILDITHEKPRKILEEIAHLQMPRHHQVKTENLNLKRLGAVLALAHEASLQEFESLILLEGIGPRAIQALTLVSEVIHGTPSRFSDPARFSFAHGGKDGHPFPVPLKIFDESIEVLSHAVEKAKLGFTEKSTALKKLSFITQDMEKDFLPFDHLENVIQKEKDLSAKYGGMTAFGPSQPIEKMNKNGQYNLFK